MSDRMTEDELSAYHAGYDCGINGANTTNRHFSYFTTRDKTKAWELGKAKADARRAEAKHE